jgi:hypothetical protein
MREAMAGRDTLAAALLQQPSADYSILDEAQNQP